MLTYKYRALLRDGKMIRGKIEANNKHQVMIKLKEAKLQPLAITRVKSKNTKDLAKNNYKKGKVSRVSSNLISKSASTKKITSIKDLKDIDVANVFTTISDKDLVSFANSMYILKKASFNNVQALESVWEGTDNPKFRDIIEDMLIGVQAGEKMSTIMEGYPRVFPMMFINFVKVGEESGSLDRALLYARDYIESSNKLTKKVKGIVIPRVLQVVGILLMIMVSVIIGVPIIQNVYDMFDSATKIPKATMIALEVSTWLLNNWFLMVLLLLVIIGAFISYRSTPKGRYNLDRMALKFPVIGRLVTDLLLNKFFKAMLLNLNNGMRIQESIDVAKEISNNYYFLAIVEVAKNNSLVGESWIEPFEQEKVFTPMVREMIKIGMETDLTEMMTKVNEYIEQELEESLAAFNKWLPEITYIFVGIALIALVLTVLVPVIQVEMGAFITY